MSIFWPHYQAYSQSVPTTFLPMPTPIDHRGVIRRRLNRVASWRTTTPEQVRRVREQLDERGPNILLVYALNSRNVEDSRLLDPVWELFDVRLLNLVDTVQPDHLPKGSVSRFDMILSFCPDLAAQFQRETGVQSVHYPPHCDVLAYHSIRENRPIDLILVGRRDPVRHAPLHRYFNAPERDRLFLDFVTRTQATPLAEEEFGLLMATYSR
jgi:hypothetical protein